MTDTPAAPGPRLSLERVLASAQTIDPVFLNSPQYGCEPLSEALDVALTLKLEFTNPIRSFKGRGASFLVREMAARGDTRTVMCGSAGNFGQAMAHACRAAGRGLVVYAAENANPLKIGRMRALGADVRLSGHDFDAAKAAARVHAAQTGGVMIEDGREAEISEGHGTLALELLAGARHDAVTVPLGNGALLAGVGLVFKTKSPQTKVYGICASGADAMRRSWQRGEVVSQGAAHTIADGIAVRVPIPEALDDLRGTVDDVLLVEDSHILAAMRLLYRHAGLLVEPAGAAGVAALLAHPELFRGQHVATPLCGSNLTDEQVRAWVLG